MFSSLHLESLDEPGRFRLLEPLTWRHAELPGEVYIVPAGTETDLASIPVGLRNVFSRLGRSRKPAVVHDHMYENRWESRAICDTMFRLALIDSGMGKWKARMYWLGVRMGGWTRGSW